MSIFQSSFPDYVFKQLKIREEILKHGNDNSRFGRPQAKIKIGKSEKIEVNIAAGAFYTNTIERQCTIRMSSGVNIDGSNDMAQRFVLMGGTSKEGGGQREGFIRQDQKGNAYGDSRIFSEADDGFGIVPMPGIVDANIRTKSAYGSLREAKVNFVCHNRRQLEVLERLYMRPGFPIMLEWGWTPFIDNNGDIETIVSKIGGFFTKGSKINNLQDEINKRKVDTGGNYDGFLGVCKNFEFKATPAGGYECSTDIIAMGEVLEGLKGKRSGNSIILEGVETEVDEFEFYLHAIKEYGSAYKDKNEKSATYTNEVFKTNAKLFQSFQKLGEIINADATTLFQATSDEQLKNISEKEVEIRAKRGKTKKEKSNKHRVFARTKEGKKYSSELERIEKLLDKFIIRKGEFMTGKDYNDKGKFEGSPHTYIRWDFLAHLMNSHILEEYQKDENIAELSWHNTNNQYYDYVRTQFSDKALIPYEQDEQTGESTKTFPLSDILDISLNPSKALLPHQIGSKLNFGQYWSDSILIKDSQEKEGGSAGPNSIGFIFLGVEYLMEKYKGMRYNSDGELNPNFKILNFLKEVWEKDINDVCGGSHNFMIHHDKENTTKVRVVDLIYQSKLSEKDLYQFNIQDNKSIIRDFNFNSTIPSALSATMAVVAQNPDSINDMEGVTISSMNKGLTNRFSIPIIYKKNDENLRNIRITDERKLIKLATLLKKFQIMIIRGNYNQENEKGSIPNTITIQKASSSYQTLINLIESLLIRYPLSTKKTKGKFEIDGENKAGHKRIILKSSKSSIIPLKFTCKMDGIGGIVIGNVFKINKKRLPIGYQGKDIAFMTHAESQTITSGQDWTTEISGQLLLLDDKEILEKEHNGIILSPGDFTIKELGLETDKLTPNADKLRQVLEAIGYTEKGHKSGQRGINKGQLTENGDITEEMFILAANIFITIKQQLGDKVKIEATGGNDNYHKNSETSRHKFGRAVDFVIKEPIPKNKKDPTSENYDKNLYIIEKIIRSFVGAKSAEGNIRYLNEYVFPSPKSSGDHFHLSLNNLQGQGSEGGPEGFNFQQNFTGPPGEEEAIDNLTLSEKLILGDIVDEQGFSISEPKTLMSESVIESAITNVWKIHREFKFEEPQK